MVRTSDSYWFVRRPLKPLPPIRPKESHVRVCSTQEGGVLDAKRIGIQPWCRGAAADLCCSCLLFCCSGGGIRSILLRPSLFFSSLSQNEDGHRILHCIFIIADERGWSMLCEVDAEQLADWSFVRAYWPFNGGSCISPISGCCIVFSSKQSTSLGYREKLSAAAATMMSHYQLVNSLSDSLAAPFTFFPFLFFHANDHLTLSGFQLFTGYALQVMSH